MHFEFRMLFLIFFVPQSVISSQCPNLKTDIKYLRKRRHVGFPEGSNFVLTMDLAKNFLTHAPSGWALVMDLDVVFPLPDQKFIRIHSRRKLHHRQKREFWDRVKDALYLHNFDGYSCVLRAICESKAHLASPGKSLVHDILRAVFSAPVEDEEFSEEIKNMYDHLKEPGFCENRHQCPFSILSFILDFNSRERKIMS